MVANTFSYQFHLVSNNMAVNNSGLALGDFPFAEKAFTSWYDCWSTLRAHGQLGRASTMFSRRFHGPVMVIGKELVPVSANFGPVHPEGLGLRVLDTRKTPLEQIKMK
jgi:hypothetical protein